MCTPLEKLSSFSGHQIRGEEEGELTPAPLKLEQRGTTTLTDGRRAVL